MQQFVIIGAGQAGQTVATTLRSEGFEGRITLIGAETAAPYQRPPLSKAYLLGEMSLERLSLRPESFYAQNRIDLRLGASVTGLDTQEKTLGLAGGERLSYDRLALTTGAIARRLPAAIGGHLAGVFTMRTLADADAIRPQFTAGKRLLIVGGGYIGLEAAAVAAKLGLEVTLVEMSARILQRVASVETSDYFRDLHQRHGVTIRESCGLDHLEGTEAVERAVLSDGTLLEVDFVIVGVGILPDTDLAEMAGLTLENGIRTDALGCTSDPAIFAAGDCASFPYGGEHMRLESVGNAIDQGTIVAKNMLGQGIPYTPKPWFWSDQFDCKLQIAGLSTGHDQTVVRDGGASRSHWYYRDGQLIAIDAMNDPRAYMVAKRLIEAGKTADPRLVGDASADLKPLLSA
ncbi:Ferredoxin--NAD(P)(+) reductase fdr [Aquimixticola soesokkakensis]|uniref:Ferredoxin--NAD(P)(+) reductase fdr n=1 Tax=Aquimixticola soesokkakensis TaxID=1519096 RepID=A0A1Y5RHD2_9RHOB|nr:FAD-dependent oxidoreductase [Aquimixticola soesokkakensis]SLN16638.1 Ferredoxin--NAD(P)(+) reductase fdr [Aquimixticola soesokkakensis]